MVAVAPEQGEVGVAPMGAVKREEAIRMARVVRAEAVAETETPIVIEAGTARVAVRRGFDDATLQRVLRVCGGGQ